ncbi:Hemerythrin-like domain-containing protein [Malonomonas rubra DSM 5091]|jgi:hemerythrin-like domain-containing protein|uniref:Hemerythrin-like domain-containing protein n=1 Tax=Malonomonas rubra DSM 5091 TaxID=1122189 RepID=A0A1M6NH35_MALRU|nr:hemerythrin domain-containing protein [Malonomonas rubra]SHJ75410.1 Hemerythrin-like domain-containing protein [Malonomonas rubra DSM 5091]SHJ95009.1 Hemerythrin-like domain-containing protein [Malonomonas rubra DSM 5091]
MKTNVTQVMSDEHQLILRMITLVEQNTELMGQGKFRNWQFFLDAVDFIRNYADRFHHAKEEDVLFVELVKNGMPAKQSPIEAMQMEHEQGRAFVRGLEEAAQKALAGEPGQIPLIAENARGYAGLLRGHIDKEDTILYPLAERVLPEDVRERMLAAYDQAEEQTPGLEERYCQLVEAYERQQ